MPRTNNLAILLSLAFVLPDLSSGFTSSSRYSCERRAETALLAAKRLAKKKKTTKNHKKRQSAASSSAGGGFGSHVGKWDGCEELRHWLRDRDARVDGVNVGVVDTETGLRGVTAARNFARGDVIFEVPRDACILDEAKADLSPIAAALYPTEADRRALAAPIRNALHVLYLQHCQVAGQAWKPALAAFPTELEFAADGGPMQLWSAEEIARVECPQLIAEVHSRGRTLRLDYDDKILPKWQTACDDPDSPLAGISPPSFDEFQHAVCVVTSRNFGNLDDNDQEGSSSMLVPGVDLCNHDDPNCVNTKHALAPWGNFVVLAQKPIVKGEQILLSYGALPNRVLLAQFGFLLTDRVTPLMSDTALVRIDGLFTDDGDNNDGEESTNPGTPDSEAAADAKWEAGSGPGRLINLQRANKNVRGRISRWQPATVARSAAEQVAVAPEEADLLYRGLLERELRQYSTTLVEDEALLARYLRWEGKDELLSSPRGLWALRFRIEAKRLIATELSSVVGVAASS